MKNERTSKRVAKLAAMILALDDYYLDVWINDDPERARKALRTLAGSDLTQAKDKTWSDVDAALARKRDDIGYDPRDGGKVGRQHVPKQKRKRGSSPYYPAAKPKRSSP